MRPPPSVSLDMSSPLSSSKALIVEFASRRLGEYHLGNIIFGYFAEQSVNYDEKIDEHIEHIMIGHIKQQAVLNASECIVRKLADYVGSIGHLPAELDFTANRYTRGKIDWEIIKKSYPDIGRNLRSLKINGQPTGARFLECPNLRELSMQNTGGWYKEREDNLLLSKKFTSLEKLTVGKGVFRDNKDFQYFLRDPDALKCAGALKELDFDCWGSFAFLRRFSNLRKLTLRSPGITASPQNTLSFPELTEMNLHIADLTEHTYQFNVPKLSVLTIEFAKCSSLDWLETIDRSNLTCLRIHMIRPSYAFLDGAKRKLLTFVRSCPKLTTFTCNVMNELYFA